MKLLHQCGHNTIWNVKALESEGAGDGLIVSPVHEKADRVESILSTSIRKRSLFDPQYYLPNSQKVKLHSYEFFPEAITNGFSTLDFSLFALKSAKLCLEFQLQQGFERVVIPARFFKQMVSDFTEQQEAYCVVPFLKEISRQKVRRPVLLTLPLTSQMVEDAAYRTAILNWVTSFPEITGAYLIVDNERNTKQITSKTFLLEMLILITELKEAGLSVVVGYSNTESLLYLITGDIDITMGAYENTRMFSLDKFIESDEDRRGPKARIYLPGLLNWIQFGQAKELKIEAHAIWLSVYEPTTFAETVLKQAAEPAFNQLPLYMHHFICMGKQVDELRGLSRVDRFKKISGWLKKAAVQYQAIEELPLALERHGSGSHIQPWLDAVNAYYRKYLKT